MPPTILVTGATGNQGGATVKELLRLDKDVQIHALVRNPSSSASQNLIALSPNGNNNVKLFKGDFDDVASIQAAAAGCTGAFLNVVPAKNEVLHVQNMVKACAATPSLGRVVYSSSGAMHHPPESTLWSEFVPNQQGLMGLYMKSKMACEDAVTEVTEEELRDGWCIIRGNTFLTNYVTPTSKFMYPDLDKDQTITTAFGPELTLSHLDPGDLGVFAAGALLCERERWVAKFKGKFVPVGKQNLTMEQVVQSMNRVLEMEGVEKRVKVKYMSLDEARERAAQGDMIIDAQLMCQAYPNILTAAEAKGHGVDVDGMVGVDEFFQREKDALIAAVGGR